MGCRVDDNKLIEGGVVGRGRNSFLSVAVITCASHAQGRRFEPGRKHDFCAVKLRAVSIAVWPDSRPT